MARLKEAMNAVDQTDDNGVYRGLVPPEQQEHLDIQAESLAHENKIRESVKTAEDFLQAVEAAVDNPSIKTEAQKDDAQKVMMSLIPVRAKQAIAEVLTYGAVLRPRKDGTFGYGIGNWKAGKGFNWQRLMDALERHLDAFKLKQDEDPESAMLHLAHAGCCLMFLLEYQLTNHGQDDRAQSQIITDADGRIVA